MNTVWIVMGLGVAGALVAALSSWRRGGTTVELGVVSRQWISEHRLGHGQDSRP